MAQETTLVFADAVSRPFLLKAFTYRDASELDPGKDCGKPYNGDIVLPGGKAASLHGLAAKAVMGRSTVRSTAYTLELRPWFHFLKLGTGCRLFQNKTAPEIVKAVATEAGYTDLKESLTGSYPKLEYAVQYNESDFDFCSRLLEEAGIFYYFAHEKGKHTMVLADSPQGCLTGPALQWIGENFPETPDSCIWNVGLERSVPPAAVQVDDYNYLTPTAGLLAKSGKGYPNETEFGTGHPTQSDGETIASRRLDGWEQAALELTAESSHSGLCAGMLFTLQGHPQSGLNKKWLITDLEMTIAESGRCRVSLRAVPGDKPFRPPRRHPRPRVFGPLTGVVCGKAGEEIWTDEHGRVKVRFHWDHKTPADETASAWLRVVQPWAGKGRGALFLPRVGDEVLISFLGGDADRPVVTGSLYNAAAQSPWKLPDDHTVSGFKTRSSPGGQAGNEISLDDKKDAERLYCHAQKLLEILAEDERRVTVNGEGGDSLTLEKGGRTVLIKKGGLTLTLEEGGRSAILKKGGDTLTLEEGGRTVELKKGGDTLKVKGDRAVTVEGGEKRHTKKNLELKVDGDYTVTVKGDLTVKAKNIRLESDQALNAKSGTAMEIKAGTTFKAQSGTDAEVKAGTGLTLTGGATFKLSGSAKGEVNGGGMLEVKGGMVKLN